MINKKNIKNKINSIKYIYKITKSMEMISISKFKNLYNKLLNNNIYYSLIKDLIVKKINIFNNYLLKNFIKNKKLKKILYLIICSDNGLCGNLNYNLMKKIYIHIKNKNYLNNKIIFFFIRKKKYIKFKLF